MAIFFQKIQNIAIYVYIFPLLNRLYIHKHPHFSHHNINGVSKSSIQRRIFIQIYNNCSNRERILLTGTKCTICISREKFDISWFLRYCVTIERTSKESVNDISTEPTRFFDRPSRPLMFHFRVPRACEPIIVPHREPAWNCSTG